MARVLAIANQKGGVGKTTTAVNLAASLAAAEKETLLIDLDPQANSSSSLSVRVDDDEACVYDLLMNGIAPDDVIKRMEYNYFSLIPSHIRLVGAEVELVDRKEREYNLSRAIKLLRDRFDYILIDCPPSLGLLTLNGLTASDGVLIPIQTEYFALEGLSSLVQTIKVVQRRLNPHLQIAGIIMTMYDPRLNLARQVHDEVRKFFPNHVLDTVIRRNIRLAEAPSFGKPVIHFAINSPGANDYLALADEILKRGAA